MNAYPKGIYVGSKWLPKRMPIAILIAGVALSITPQSHAAYLGGDDDPCLIHGGASDSDGDTIIDRVETDADTDGDGIPNYLDLDSDNDGLSDKDEYRYSAQIGLGAWVNSEGSDNDNDGIRGSRDVDDFDSSIVCYRYTEGLTKNSPYYASPPAADFNKDGLPDFLDPDSDDDGLLDSEEKAYGGMFTVDTDSDGLTDVYELQLGLNPAKADTDGGGANDDWELVLNSDPFNASDDAALPIDLDVDNDGIANSLEWTNEFNHDSDNDGRSDAAEAGLLDADNDGFVDDQADANLNGQPDVGESLTVLPDFDNDSIPDMYDVDSDQDSIPDRREFNNIVLPPEYGIDVNDADGDGALNMYDLDSDNDGIFDINENGPLLSTFTSPDGYFLSELHKDADGNGQIDEMLDTDRDYIPDLVDASIVVDAQDTDGDGIIDSADVDHAVRTVVGPYDYSTNTPSITHPPSRDTDGDGIEDDSDPDANGDGGYDLLIVRELEFIDADGDGIPAILDTDDASVFVAPQLVASPAQASQTSNTAQNSGGGGIGVSYLFIIAVGVFCRRSRPLS